MLNKAREIMKQRESMIKEAQETLVVLGATNDATIVNQIVINKGKVTAIETTNDEYIEQLLKDLDNRNKRIEELKAQLAREEQLYKDLEFEANEEIDAVAAKRDKRIKELEAQLASKDLLLNEFREAMDEKVSKIHELEDKMEGMKIGYERKITELKAKQVTIEVVDDPMFNQPAPEETTTKGGDAVEDFSQYITVTIPDKYKNNNEIKDLIKTSEERWNRSHRKQTLKHMNDQILVIIARLEAQSNCNMNLITKGKDVIGVQGQITIEGVTYQCKYVKTHVLPMLAGCFNMDHILKAKDMILAMDQRLVPTEEAYKRQDNMHYDFDNKIVVYIEEDGSFKGYNDKEMFVWDSGRYPWPSRRTFAHAIDNTPARSFKGVGQAAEKRAFAIMQYIRENFMKAAKEENLKITKESQVANDDYLETDDEDL